MLSVITALQSRLTECPGVTDVVSQGGSVSGCWGKWGQTQHAHSTSWWLFPWVATSQNPIPTTPAVENYTSTILTPFTLIVFVRVVDLENRNKHLLVCTLYRPTGSVKKIIIFPFPLVCTIRWKPISSLQIWIPSAIPYFSAILKCMYIRIIYGILL